MIFYACAYCDWMKSQTAVYKAEGPGIMFFFLSLYYFTYKIVR